MYKKLWSDGQTNGQKKWHREVGTHLINRKKFFRCEHSINTILICQKLGSVWPIKQKIDLPSPKKRQPWKFHFQNFWRSLIICLKSLFTNKKITTNLSYCFYFAWICHEFCLYCFKKQVEIKFMFKEHLQWYYLLVKIAILLFIWLLLDCFLVFRAIHTTSSVFGILTKWF